MQSLTDASSRRTVARRTANPARSKHRHPGFGRQVLQTLSPLLIADVIACLGSLYLGAICSAAIWSHGATGYGATGFSPHFAMVTTIGLVIVFIVMGLYSGTGMNPVYEFRQCMLGVTFCYVLVVSQRLNSASSLGLLIAFPIMLATVWIARSAARHFLSKSSWWGVRCLVFSADQRVNQLFEMHLKNRPNGFRPVGFIQDEIPESTDSTMKPFWLGGLAKTGKLANRHNAFVALVHRRGRSDNELALFQEEHLSHFNQIVIVPDDERLPLLWAMGKDGGLVIRDRLLQPSSQFVKRSMDIVISGSVLALGFPFFALIALWMKVTSPGPLFFGHERIGRHGRKFKTWKFRTMCVNADEVLQQALAGNPALKAEWDATQKLKNDPRVSSSGRFLRKSSLDEIPQLWNVLKGEMSLVGPRPIVASEVEKYEEKFDSYTRVTPGVTGFWQISGRNLTTYEKRVELDDYYVRNWSIWFDLYILFRTVKTVLLREGAF